MFVSFQNFLYFCAMISKQELTAQSFRHIMSFKYN